MESSLVLCLLFALDDAGLTTLLVFAVRLFASVLDTSFLGRAAWIVYFEQPSVDQAIFLMESQGGILSYIMLYVCVLCIHFCFY